jgi:hypothetical protein
LNYVSWSVDSACPTSCLLMVLCKPRFLTAMVTPLPTWCVWEKPESRRDIDTPPWGLVGPTGPPAHLIYSLSFFYFFFKMCKAACCFSSRKWGVLSVSNFPHHDSRTIMGTSSTKKHKALYWAPFTKPMILWAQVTTVTQDPEQHTLDLLPHSLQVIAFIFSCLELVISLFSFFLSFLSFFHLFLSLRRVIYCCLG